MSDDKLEVLRRLAKEVDAAESDLRGKYFALLRHVRSAHVGPRDLSRVLGELGWHKVRISEVKRVAYVPDVLFAEYEAGVVGFKTMLEKVRAEKPDDLAPARVGWGGA